MCLVITTFLSLLRPNLSVIEQRQIKNSAKRQRNCRENSDNSPTLFNKAFPLHTKPLFILHSSKTTVTVDGVN